MMTISFKQKFTSLLIALALGLAPFIVKGVPAENLETKIAGHTIQVQVDNTRTHMGIPKAYVEAVNQVNPSRVYSDSTDASGRAVLEDVTTFVRADDRNIPDDYDLFPAFPNPFNPKTTLRFGVSNHTNVDVSVYNVRGQLVKTLVDSDMDPGMYQVGWDGTDDYGRQVAEGVYIGKMTTVDGFADDVKMTLLHGSQHGDAPSLSKIGNYMPKMAKATSGEAHDFTVTHPDYETYTQTIPLSADTTLYFELTPKNIPPKVVARASATDVKRGEQLELFGSDSYDPDGTVESWHWITGDGTTSDQPDFTHVYQNPGEYDAKLTITDNNGATADTTIHISVSDLEKITKGLVMDIDGDSLLSGQPATINGETVYSDSNGVFMFSNLPPGDYRITVGDGTDYASMERTITVSDQDTSYTIPMRLVENDPGLIEFLNGTVFAGGLRGSQKWPGPAINYINKTNMDESSQEHAEAVITDPDLGESTYGVHSYTAGDINKVTEEERPEYGTPGTFIWDNIDARSIFAIYENPENPGIIDAAVVSLPNGSGIEAAYHEGLSGYTGIDEVIRAINNKYESARNDPSNLDHISDYDIIINKFNQDRDPNTTDGDVGPYTAMAKAVANGATVVVDGQVVGEKDLTYEQVNVLHKLIDDSGRIPKYLVFN